MPEEVNGHASDDAPEFEEMPEIGASSAPAQGGIPGLSNVFMQPTPGGGMWNPVERAMRGSTKAEEYLPLTNVQEEDITLHMQILYFSNLYNYGNGRLDDCLWTGYQLRRAINGEFMGQVVDMVTGERRRNEKNAEERRQAFLQRMRGNEGGNTVGKLYG